MPSAMLAAATPDSDAPRNDAEAIFGGLLLALVGGRRLVALVGTREGERIGLLAKLARRLENDDMMVLTVGATEGVLVEDLIEVAGRSQLGARADMLDFEGLLDTLEKRLDRSGSGVLMVDNADRLTPDTLRDLMDLSADTTPSGTALQVLVSGGPDLELRLKQADLDAAIAAVGTIYRLDPVTPQATDPPETSRDRLIARTPGVREEREDGASPTGSRRGPGWMAVATTALLAAVAMYVIGQDPFSLREGTSGGLFAERSSPSPTEPGMPSGVTAATVSGTPDRTAGSTPPDADPSTVPQPAEPVIQPSLQRDDAEPTVDPEVGLADTTAAQADAAEQVDPVPPPPAAESVPLEQDDVAPFREPEPPPARTGTTGGANDGTTPIPAPADTATTNPTPGSAASAGTSVAAVPAAPQPSGEIRRSPAEERRILALLSQAEAQMSQRRLTTPTGDNALETLQELASIDPEHSAIPAMRQRMIETYRVWGRQAEGRGEWDFARTYYQRALRVQPANREMTRLLDGIDQRRRTNRPIGAETAPARQPETRTAEDGGNRPPVPTLRP